MPLADKNKEIVMNKPSIRNTKKEILDAYIDLEKSFTVMKNEAPQTNLVNQTSTANNVNMSTMLGQFNGLKSQFADAANDLQQQLVDKATQLQNLHQQTQFYIGDLHDLHQIEVNEQSLAELMTKYETTIETQQEILAEEQLTCTDIIDEQRQQWHQQQQQQRETLKEAEKERKKQRQRDQQEFQYDCDQQHQKDADDFEQQQKIYTDKLKAKEEQHQQDWAEKETLLSEQEQKAQKITKQAESLEHELEQAVKKAEEEGYGIAKVNVNNKASLLEKEYEGQERLFALKIDNLQHTLGKQDKQIQELSKQLSITQKQAQDLAVKALEGTANASSFNAINAIALEQAKHSGKGK